MEVFEYVLFDDISKIPLNSREAYEFFDCIKEGDCLIATFDESGQMREVSTTLLQATLEKFEFC